MVSNIPKIRMTINMPAYVFILVLWEKRLTAKILKQSNMKSKLKLATDERYFLLMGKKKNYILWNFLFSFYYY